MSLGVLIVPWVLQAYCLDVDRLQDLVYNLLVLDATGKISIPRDVAFPGVLPTWESARGPRSKVRRLWPVLQPNKDCSRRACSKPEDVTEVGYFDITTKLRHLLAVSLLLCSSNVQ